VNADEITPETWIDVPRWDEFQHYKDRHPLWIKLYTRLLQDADFLGLSLAARGLLITVWCNRATENRPFVVKSLSLHVRRVVPTRALIELETAGFVTLSASTPLADRYQAASTYRERSTTYFSKERASERATENGSRSHAEKENPARNVCPQCGVGAGLHAADCPQVTA